MKHITALIYKLIIITLITVFFTVILGGYTFWQAFMLSIAATVLLYAVGDLFVLPAAGNGVATAVDAGTAAVLMWLIPFMTTLPDIAFFGALMIGAVIGVAEYFFHQYLLKEILPGSPVRAGDQSDH